MSVTHARVTNENEFDIEERSDGVPFVFTAGKVRVIPLEAAALIFGMPVDDDGNVTFQIDHGYMARRWGWNVLEKRDEKELTSVAMERLARETAEKLSRIHVEPVTYALREIAGPSDLPAPRDTALGIGAEISPEDGEVVEDEIDDEPEKRSPGRPRKQMTVGG